MLMAIIRVYNDRAYPYLSSFTSGGMMTIVFSPDSEGNPTHQLIAHSALERGFPGKTGSLKLRWRPGDDGIDFYDGTLHLNRVIDQVDGVQAAWSSQLEGTGIRLSAVALSRAGSGNKYVVEIEVDLELSKSN
jgi:hypothetical protein